MVARLRQLWFRLRWPRGRLTVYDADWRPVSVHDLRDVQGELPGTITISLPGGRRWTGRLPLGGDWHITDLDRGRPPR